MKFFVQIGEKMARVQAGLHRLIARPAVYLPKPLFVIVIAGNEGLDPVQFEHLSFQYFRKIFLDRKSVV